MAMRQPAAGNFVSASALIAATRASVTTPSSFTRLCQRTRLPGTISPVASRAARVIITRGPKSMPLPILSGSEAMAAVTRTRALPISRGSPTLIPRRAISSGSTAAPKLPSGRGARASLSVTGCSKRTVPASG